MKVLKSSAVLMAGILASASALAQCPAAGQATGCDTNIVINPGGTLTITPNAGINPYDGSDDNLVGITNKSGASVSFISLSGSGNGGGLFNFDGDGIDGYVPIAFNSKDPSGYGGPQSYFTNISTDLTSGDVNFIGGLSNNAFTYFSLESAIQGATITGGGGGSVTPEPSTFVLLGTGALSLAGGLRRRFMRR